jgi:hypothetical protein
MTISYATLCNGCASHRNSPLEIDGCVSCPHSRIKGCRCINQGSESGARKVIAATSDANFGIKGGPATYCF